jgi:hypothetical protein
MRTIATGADVRPLALLEALQAASIPVTTVHPDGRIVLDVGEDDDSFDAAVLAVLAAHDVGAIDAAEAAKLAQMQTDIANLKAFMQAANNTITLPMLVAVVKAFIRVARQKWLELQD